MAEPGPAVPAAFPVGPGFAVGVAAALRRHGVAVPVEATVTFARAVAEVGDRGPGALYWAGRATLVKRPEDVPAWDRTFAALLGVAGPAPDGGPSAEPAPPQPPARALPGGDAGDGDGDRDPEGPARDPALVAWSATEALRRRDFAACSPDELAEAHRLVAAIRLRAPARPSRRRRPARPGGPHTRIDLRRTVATALRHGGEVGRPAATAPSTRPRRLVLLLDVSGSMAPYARAFARLAHAAVAAHRRGGVEVFALGTRLTRITRELATQDPDAALARAAAAVADWDGGTRLGPAVRAVNVSWGDVARGATVVVLSDGWDRGDPAVLGAELARLRRLAHRLVWVNPLKASPGFAPTAGGMAAALPHVDELVEGHSVAALEDLATVITGGAGPAR